MFNYPFLALKDLRMGHRMGHKCDECVCQSVIHVLDVRSHGIIFLHIVTIRIAIIVVDMFTTINLELCVFLSF